VTLKRTGGGTFDPARRGIFFLAGGDAYRNDLNHPHILVATNELSKDSTRLDRFLDEGRTVFLDSGIFNLASDHARRTGGSLADAWVTPPEQVPGFDDLWNRYVAIATRYRDRLWGYAEMDLGGTDSKRRLRTQLEDLGLAPIPIYHPLYDGWDYFDELAETYDRVAWANLTGPNLRRPTRVRLLTTAWERHRRYPDLWLHLLGYTPSEWSPGFLAADSSDSSSWVAGARYGQTRATTHLRSLGKLPPGYVSKVGEAGHYSAARLQGEDYSALALNWQQLRADHTTHLHEPVPPISEELP
jgi:hypothetical protein